MIIKFSKVSGILSPCKVNVDSPKKCPKMPESSRAAPINGTSRVLRLINELNAPKSIDFIFSPTFKLVILIASLNVLALIPVTGSPLYDVGTSYVVPANSPIEFKE